MFCPSDKCGSSNVEHLPHYWASLPGDSPLKVKYAQPDEGNARARLILAGVALVGIVVLATGGVALGLAMLAVGGAGGLWVHGQIQAAELQRGTWSRSQICLACTHLWTP
jgi:hypothetical protein